MSLQFFLGASGSGKSYQLQRKVLEMAKNERNKNFFFIVPDQFTMQTQKDLVTASSCQGILNVDVLSFTRLAHRVFEELGLGTIPVLEDTGKSLILTKLAGELSEDMPLIGHNLKKTGYIHEIKSVISEFKQYDINEEKLRALIEFSENKGLLNQKLRDIGVIYEAFNNYIRDEYVTSEETISLLADKVYESKLVRGAVVIFDGFTGFTPVQYRLIQALLELTEKVIVSVTIDIDSQPFKDAKEQDLFYLSKKTIKDLQKCAQLINVKEDDPILLNETVRFKDNPVLLHIERNIFRYPIKIFDGDCRQSISVYKAQNPEDEVKRACIYIKKLVLDEGYQYRDIAIVCGELSAYSDYFRKMSGVYDIPFYIDETRSLVLNPFVEFLKSALNIIKENYSYSSVFHFLRSGLCDLSNDEIDRLDNYVLRAGIKGQRAWNNAFTKPCRHLASDEALTTNDIEELNRLNESRKKIICDLSPIMVKKALVSEFIEALYDFILLNKVEEKLTQYEEYFILRGMTEKAKEYSQVYRLVIELLEQMHSLLKDEKMDITQFIEIFESGIEEIDIGTIPGGVDRCIVGDMERTRLTNVKILMFLGVNDGYIPKSNAKGGIISDFDREYLKEAGIELAPTPREQIFSQRLYLYLNITKPSKKLYLSYSRMGNDAKSMLESYVISNIKKMFPKLIENEEVSSLDEYSQICGKKDGFSIFAPAAREYATGNLKLISEEEFLVLFKHLYEDEEYREKTLDIIAAAFYGYKNERLNEKLARNLYGDVLRNSVSRLELFAKCEYAHFLKYGMKLCEREEFNFEYNDLGNVYHAILQSFSSGLMKEGYSLRDYPKEVGDRLLDDSIKRICYGYNGAVLESTAANEYRIHRIKNIMQCVILSTKEQLSKGEFSPAMFEQKINHYLTISDDVRMVISGSVDRIDLCEHDGKTYIKVIDYKSGEKDFELDALYYGLSLQQTVYMNEAYRLMRKQSTECDPKMAAMLYYHIDNPLIKEDSLVDESKARKDIESKMRPTGLVSDDEIILAKLDEKLTEPGYKSMAVPVERKKDGSFTSNSKIISDDNFDTISVYAENKMFEMANSMIKGSKEINPKVFNEKDPCKYCDYKDICSFDSKIKGYEKTVLPRIPFEEVIDRMSGQEETD